MTTVWIEPIAARAAPRGGAATLPAKALRIDIQIARAWAIILVLLHHANMPGVPGGFLGVDIFFVISGYLMTGIVDAALDEGRFTFAGFYARRVRRLLPAAYATLLVTACCAPLLLDATEYHFFVRQLAGAFGFVANLVLWKQADYFSTGAPLKPLLHIWSLSLEEQYYALLPLALFLSPGRLRLPLVIAATALSFAACLFVGLHAPSANFYLLPTRAWELGLGSAVALAVRRRFIWPFRGRIVRGLCALPLVILPFVVNEQGHPGWPAAIMCAAMAAMMVPGLALQPRGWSRLPLLIGNRSYSLYLVHWPLFAFANNICIGGVPLWVNGLLLIACALLAELQYRFVEQRWRGLAVNRRSLLLLAAIPVAAIGLSAGWAARTPIDPARADNPGLAKACAAGGGFVPLAACRTAAAPATLLWGDSIAMQFGQALGATMPGGIVQATKYSCAPFLGIAPVDGVQLGRGWAQACIRFNDSVLAYAAAHPELRTVILSTALLPYLPGGEDVTYRALSRQGGGFRSGPIDDRWALTALAETVAALHRLGRRVVLIAPPPSANYDTGRCLDRIAAGKPTVTGPAGCAFTAADYRARRAPTHRFLADARVILPVVDFDALLCGSGVCRSRIGAVPLYRDHVHFSIPGAQAIAQQSDLAATLLAKAR